MTLLHGALLAQAVAVLLAVVLGASRRSYRPAALYLGAVLGITHARRALIAGILAPAREAMRARGLDPALQPLVGPRELAAVLIDGALAIGSHALLVAVALEVFGVRRRWLVVVAGVWALGSVLLAAGYPSTRGPTLGAWYTAAGLLAVAGVLVAVARWTPRRERPKPAHVVVALSAGLTLAVLLATRGAVFTRWRAAETALLLGHAAISIMEAVWISRSAPR